MPYIFEDVDSRYRYVGLTNLKKFYGFFYDIFVTMEYNVDETKYTRKDKEGGVEYLNILWNATKKVDDFTMFKIFVIWMIPVRKKTEVQRGNVKVSMDFVDLDMRMMGDLVMDYDGKWDKNPFLKPLINIWIDRIYRTTYMEWRLRLYQEVNQIHNHAKTFFGLKQLGV